MFEGFKFAYCQYLLIYVTLSLINIYIFKHLEGSKGGLEILRFLVQFPINLIIILIDGISDGCVFAFPRSLVLLTLTIILSL
jgi:hypothetical protein